MAILLLGLAGCASSSTPKPYELLSKGIPFREVSLFQHLPPLVPRDRIPNPVSRPLQFTEAQRFELRSSLQPGDILFTYTACASSNLLVPGRFKHALVFVGNESERTRAGVTGSTASTPTDEDADWDVVEALREGVVRSRLDEILEKKVNRLVVLRPTLSASERQAYLNDVVSYVGEPYDFSFNYFDPTRKTCTEVVYWSLQNRGGIHLQLVPRAGREVLTADDILRYHLRNWESGVGFVTQLYVDEDTEHSGWARVHYGPAGHDQLTRLMHPQAAAAAPTVVEIGPVEEVAAD